MEKTADQQALGAKYWLGRGMREAICLPTFVLIFAFIGFAGFAKESGVSLTHALVISVFVWALPACVVLVTAIASGATFIATLIAVALSSARLMPMTAAMIPEIRTEKSKTWRLLLLSHFVAITAWVISMERFKEIPKPGRAPFFVGLALVINLCAHTGVIFVYVSANSLPPEVLGALFFLTPIYFMQSLWGSARETTGRIALIVGFVMGPIVFKLMPGVDLLVTGFVGGTLAYVIGRTMRKSA